jgi:hypothetical protein
MPATASLPSKVGTSPFAALLRSVFDLVLQVAGLMIAAELTQGCFIQVRKNLAKFFRRGITGGKPLSVNLAQCADEGVAVLVADFAVVVALAIVEACLAHAALHGCPRATAFSRWDQMATLRRNTQGAALSNNPVRFGPFPSRYRGRFRFANYRFAISHDCLLSH